VHLAFIDTTSPLAAQASWLEADLAAAEAAGAGHAFVVLHWGPYSGGPTGGNAGALATIVPVVRRHRVDAILSGHDRIYEHGVANGLHYFVTGGSGNAVDVAYPTKTTLTQLVERHYLVIEVAGAATTIRAKSMTGAILDEVALAP
jgi:hypothetical protein